MPVITTIYAALFTVLYLTLAARVIAMRGTASVSLGHGGNDMLERRIRAHGNCAEYVPLGILLLLLVELSGAPAVAVHGLGLVLLSGRIMHAVALSRPASGRLRIIGMALTLTALGLAALGLLAHSLI